MEIPSIRWGIELTMYAYRCRMRSVLLMGVDSNGIKTYVFRENTNRVMSHEKTFRTFVEWFRFVVSSLGLGHVEYNIGKAYFKYFDLFEWRWFLSKYWAIDIIAVVHSVDYEQQYTTNSYRRWILSRRGINNTRWQQCLSLGRTGECIRRITTYWQWRNITIKQVEWCIEQTTRHVRFFERLMCIVMSIHRETING